MTALGDLSRALHLQVYLSQSTMKYFMMKKKNNPHWVLKKSFFLQRWYFPSSTILSGHTAVHRKFYLRTDYCQIFKTRNWKIIHNFIFNRLSLSFSLRVDVFFISTILFQFFDLLTTSEPFGPHWEEILRCLIIIFLNGLPPTCLSSGWMLQMGGGS